MFRLGPWARGVRCGSVHTAAARREIERRLHKQQEFAHRLVDSFPDLILVLDTEANYTFVSPRCAEVLGYEGEEISEMKLGARTHPEDQPKLMALYKDIIAGRQSFASDRAAFVATPAESW